MDKKYYAKEIKTKCVFCHKDYNEVRLELYRTAESIHHRVVVIDPGIYLACTPCIRQDQQLADWEHNVGHLKYIRA